MTSTLSTGPIEVVIRTQDVYRTAAFLSVFGLQPTWTPALSKHAAIRLYGEDGPLEQLRLETVGQSSSVRLVQTHRSVRALEEFELGGYGIDFYSTDVYLSRDLAVAAGATRVEPVEWYEDGQRLVEAQIIEPDGTFAVFAPQMEAISRLHPSAIDDDPDLLHSELCMTSWVVEPSQREAERRFWIEEFGMRAILDTAMDPADMKTLMNVSRPEPISSLQLGADGFPCLIDLLTYDENVAVSRPGVSALAAVVMTAATVADDAVIAERGDGPRRVERRISPAGIPVEVWETPDQRPSFHDVRAVTTLD